MSTSISKPLFIQSIQESSQSIVKMGLSTVQNLPGVSALVTGAGLVSDSVRKLSQGNFSKAAMNAASGFTVMELASEWNGISNKYAIMSGAVCTGAIAAGWEGAKELYRGLANKEKNIISKGLLRLATGAAIFGAAALSGMRSTAIFAHTLAISACFGKLTQIGTKDILDRNYLKGIGKLTAGIIGIAGAVCSGYLTLSHPDEIISANITNESFKNENIYPEKLEMKLITVYNNNGNIERQRISDLVTDNHEEYAGKWNLEHEIITDDLVAAKCTHPVSGQTVDCSPYFNKIAAYINECNNPKSQGKIVIYADDDFLFTNTDINPEKMFHDLREGRNTSVVMMREGVDWANMFPLPGYDRHDPRISVNTGYIMAKIESEGPACDLFKRTWNHRNTRMNPGPNFDECPAIGVCKTHAITSLGDQTAMAMALQDRIQEIDRSVTIVLPGNDHSVPRFNTLHRGGCHQKLVNGHLTQPYDIDDIDNQFPNGKWRSGDLGGQPAGFGGPMGKYPLAKDANGRCIENDSQPIENIRLKKLQEMLQPRDDVEFTFCVAHTRDENSDAAQYTDLTLDNHRRYAERHGAKFYHETDKNLLKNQCVHPNTKQLHDCSPYFMKVLAGMKWLHQPNHSGKNQWLVIADDDGMYLNSKLKPIRVLEDLGTNPTASIIAVKELRPDVSVANTGLLFIKKSNESINFFNKWWGYRNAPTSDPQHPTCPSHGLCKNQLLSVNDQSAFDIAYKNHQESKDQVEIVPFRNKNRGYGINTMYREGCFLRDQAHWKSDQRIDFHQDDLRDDPTGITKPGDFYAQTAGVPREGRYCSDDESIKRPIRKQYIEQLKNMVKT